jgi:hypothetical protein
MNFLGQDLDPLVVVVAAAWSGAVVCLVAIFHYLRSR